MSKAVIFKTNALLENPTVGVNKIIVNFKPGGASQLMPINNGGITIYKKHQNATFKLKFYNGDWLTYGGNVPINPTGKSKKTYTDDYGNTINEYTYPVGYDTGMSDGFHVTIGTTRVEICDLTDLKGAGATFSESEAYYDTVVNLNQYAYTDFTEINCMNTTCVGDLSSLKNLEHLRYLGLNQSLDVTGDICNLAKSAQTLEYVYLWRTQAYGAIESFCDLLKANGAVSKSVIVSGGSSGITYQGQPIQRVTITFDANGDYTIESTPY